MNIRKMLIPVGILSVLLLVMMPAFSEEADLCAPFNEGNVDPALLGIMLEAAEDGHLYRIEKPTSRVGFCVSSPIREVLGTFDEFEGGLALTSDIDEQGQAMVIIRPASLNTNDLLINALIKGKDFFDVANYPEILFVSSDLEWTSRTTADLKGDLTIRGITRPVIFKVTLTGKDGATPGEAEKITVKATTTINRSAFGMDKMTSLVSNSVQLCMTVDASKYGT